MSINYIGADVDCMMTEIAIEKNGKITARDRVPTNIRSLRKCLDSISGKKEMVIEEGPMLVGYIEILNPMSIALLSAIPPKQTDQLRW